MRPMELSARPRSPCFTEDEGLASPTDMELSLPGSPNQNNNINTTTTQNEKHNHLTWRPVYSSRKSRFLDARYEEGESHYLHACFGCKTRLGNQDIFMYRGDTPFCSVECRQEEIERDEAKEKERLRTKSDGNKSANSSSSVKKDYDFCKGAVATA